MITFTGVPAGELIKLIGIVLIVVGFGLRMNTLLVVFVAGIVTGLVSGLSWSELMSLVGELFVNNRFMTLPIVLLVPVIGILEHYGLQEHAAAMIRKASSATAGRILLLYQVVREATSTVALHIGGHAPMVRPLIVPMAEGAAMSRTGKPLSKKLREKLRGHAAAAENWGNFFADDIIVAVGPVLLMKGVLDAAGHPVAVWEIGVSGIPTALAAVGIGWWRYRKLDKEIERAAELNGEDDADS
ncbi:MAG: putative membrane protein [Verrucomicrobiales bacterium]|jgi:uncharacterized membrane protein